MSFFNLEDCKINNLYSPNAYAIDDKEFLSGQCLYFEPKEPYKKQALTPKYPPNETLSKIKFWCARQEHCHKQTKSKLAEWGYFGAESEGIIAELISEDYLNESRFAECFVSGRYRIKKWGRIKISRHLKALGVSDPCITPALEIIDEEEYQGHLASWIEKKSKQWSSIDVYQRRGKIAQFVQNKGFEADLIWEYLNDHF